MTTTSTPSLAPLRVSRDVCRDLGQSLQLEWLESNGLGGYASGTCAGAHTRRYHGLLVAATRPPASRTLLLHKLEETVVTQAGSFEISTNLYHPDVVHPAGYQLLQGFALDPLPTWVYEVPGACVRKTVFMVEGRNAVVVRYHIEKLAEGSVRLLVRLLVNCRDHHQETHANPSFRGATVPDCGGLRLSPYDGMPSLWFAHDGHFNAGGTWYYNFRHPAESARGLADHEDAYSPGWLEVEIGDEARLNLIAWSQPCGFDQVQHVTKLAAELESTERARRATLTGRWSGEPAELQYLIRAADQFLVARDTATQSPSSTQSSALGPQSFPSSVIAGYPWFTDWGRDTLISLPGLTLVSGRFEVARRILETFVRHIDQGMVPNYFPDAGQTPEYNTIDATLWLFHAVHRYLCYTRDWDFARRVYEALVDVVRWHVRGTRYGIRVDADGLLTWDAPGVQLTWMDARVGEWVVTPRRGKPVEVNALWFNALHAMRRVAHELADAATEREVTELAARCEKGFTAFWNAEHGCLYDVLTAQGPDAQIRPNQVLAASLSFPLLRGAKARAMLSVVERELLTPLGLRSLAPSDPAYRGHYGGPPAERDGVYHQGTVWAWLIGPFVSALMASAQGGKAGARQRAAALLAPLLQHTRAAGLGSISEIFDGDAPHAPNGCPWQAWSVAEVLRAYVEDAKGKAPATL